MTKTRIQLTDSTFDAIYKVSDGNPGAVTVLARMLKEGSFIDPDDFMGGLGSLLALDSHGIYGSDIWVLFKDICEQNMSNTIGLLRAVQLGFLAEGTLKSWIGTAQASRFDNFKEVDAMIAKVKERLPNFGQ